MIVQSDFLNKLKSLGLNSYEAKLWTALLSLGTSTAGELSDVANVPRSRSYDVLDGLEKKGFIITRIGKPIKYLAIPPEEVLERVKQKIKKEYNNQTESMNSLKNSNMMKELDRLHSSGVDLIEPTDITGAIQGRDKIYSHLNKMIKDAEQSIVFVTSKEGFRRKIKQFNNVLKKANLRGVNVQMNVLNKGNNPIQRDIEEFIKFKETNNLNARFCVIDNKEVLLMLLSDEETSVESDVAVWLNSPFLASALNSLINSNNKI